MDEALRFSQSHGVRAGCQALDLPPSSLYREKLRRERPAMDPRPRPASPRALSPPEKEAVVEVLHSQRFVDKAPATVWAELLDEGRYLCSIRTMYRILSQRLEVKERRRQRRHPQYAKPEPFAGSSSIGITATIAIRVSACTLPRTCTTSPPSPHVAIEPKHWRPPMHSSRRDFPMANPFLPLFQRRFGSTLPKRRTPEMTLL